MHVGGQPVVAPLLQVVEVDVVEYRRGSVVISVGAPQLELGQLRGDVVQAPPSVRRGAGPLEVVSGASLQRIPGKRAQPSVLIVASAWRHATEGVVMVNLVQVITTLIMANQMHIDQPGQYRSAVNGWLERLQQIVHRHRRNRSCVYGQRLHDLLTERIKALKRLSD